MGIWRFGIRRFKEPGLYNHFRITEEYENIGYATVGYVGFHEDFSKKEMIMIFKDLARQLEEQKRWKRV